MEKKGEAIGNLLEMFSSLYDYFFFAIREG
jgi:hypothetical protein